MKDRPKAKDFTIGTQSKVAEFRVILDEAYAKYAVKDDTGELVKASDTEEKLRKDISDLLGKKGGNPVKIATRTPIVTKSSFV